MDQPKIKSFFERPEGNTGMVVIGAVVVGAGILVLKNIEFLINLAQNTLYFGVLLGAIFGITTLLMNKRFRFICSSMFQSAMRWITGWWIAVDPIGILKNYLLDMLEKMKRIGGYVTQLASQVGKVERDVSTRTENVEGYLRVAKAAKAHGDMENATLQSNMAIRETQYIERRKVSLKKMQETLTILKKLEKNLNFLYQDTEHQVTMLEAEYESVKASWKAMKGAQELINGDDAKAIFEQTCQYVADDIGSKLGEMDRFMEMAHGPLSTMDLNNEVFNEQGLELLANWEKTGLLSYESGQLGKSAANAKAGTTNVRVATDNTDELEAAEMQQQAQDGDRPSSFSKIFNKKS
jgi:hypothetical protein